MYRSLKLINITRKYFSNNKSFSALNKFRKLMEQYKYDAYIILNSDPHKVKLFNDANNNEVE